MPSNSLGFCFSKGKKKKACTVIDKTLQESETDWLRHDLNVLNIWAEVHMSLHDFEPVHDKLLGLSVQLADFPLDLDVKLAICEFRLSAVSNCDLIDVQSRLHALLSAPVEHYHDLRFEVGQTLQSIGGSAYSKAAAEILSPLLTIPNYDIPTVWMLLGTCCKAYDNLQESRKWYQKVVDTNPGDTDARIALVQVLMELKEEDRAFDVLGIRTDGLNETLDVPFSAVNENVTFSPLGVAVVLPEELRAVQRALVFELAKASLAWTKERYDLFAEMMLPLITSSFSMSKRREFGSLPTIVPAAEDVVSEASSASDSGDMATSELVTLQGSSTIAGGGRFLRKPQKKKKSKPPQRRGVHSKAAQRDTPVITLKMGSILPQFQGERQFVELCVKTVRALCATSALKEATELLSSMLRRFHFAEPDIVPRLRWLQFGVALHCNNRPDMLKCLKHFLQSECTPPTFWHVLAWILSQESVHTPIPRFLMRAVMKNNKRNAFLELIIAQRSVLFGAWRASVAKFWEICRVIPDQSLLQLCLSSAYLVRASSTRVPYSERRDKLISAIALFSKYYDGRSGSPLTHESRKRSRTLFDACDLGDRRFPKKKCTASLFGSIEAHIFPSIGVNPSQANSSECDGASYGSKADDKSTCSNDDREIECATLNDDGQLRNETGDERFPEENYFVPYECSASGVHEMEAAYNMGRACQYVELDTLAANHYEKVLELCRSIHADPESRPPSIAREAAHNLVRIYLASGSIDLARGIMQEFLTF
eukprot:Rmarinus@m.17763